MNTTASKLRARFDTASTRTRRCFLVVANRYVFDWARPVHAGNLYENYLQPATKALGLGAVRFHDLRHTFATMKLSAGENYMQVSKWLGHSSFVLTLSTYADYIREDELSAPKVGRGTVHPIPATVTPLRRKA